MNSTLGSVVPSAMFGDMTWTPPEIAPVTMEAMKEATDASKPKIADTAVAIGPLIVSCCLKKE